MSCDLIPVRCGCGGEAIVLKGDQYSQYAGDYFISCTKCTAGVGAYPTEAEAIEAWNRAMGNRIELHTVKERTAKVETVEKPNVYKCSKCGQYFHSTAWGSPVEYCSRCGCRLDWDEDIPMEYFESGGI